MVCVSPFRTVIIFFRDFLPEVVVPSYHVGYIYIYLYIDRLYIDYIYIYVCVCHMQIVYCGCQMIYVILYIHIADMIYH